ncbi:MAG TPA: sigma-70 family RNA polymerase sigma factor [Polyangiales bacterium]|nr:sigma-70 family RNA polymerase sigma factor [Polyangiales bacterium]
MSTTPLPTDAEIVHLPALARAPTSSAEADWVARAQRGDPAAVDWLVREHWDRVQRLLLRMFGPRRDLEDLVQTTFLETLRALPSFRRESALATFVCGIAVRVGLRARRPSKLERSTRSLEECAEPSIPPSAETNLEQAEALRRVQGILDRLSEVKRMAFLLWAVEGLPVSEVASAMNASVPATRSRIFYAQKAIRASAARDPYLRRWLDMGGDRELG